MSLRLPFRLIVLLLAAALTLSGCESSEERAERYYQSGLALLQAGDEDRALVEFRNVFKLNGRHREARETYAKIMRKRENFTEAYGQYLRLIEQYPDDTEGLTALSEMSIDRGKWDDAERYGRRLGPLNPTAPATMAIVAALDYRAALIAKDPAGKADAKARAQSVLDAAPDNLIARRLVIDFLINSPTPADAMPVIEAGLALDPNNFEMNALKLRLFAEQNDPAAIGTQLRVMADRFPDNAEIRQSLIGWYLDRKDLDGAEAFLRGLAGKAGDDPAPQLAVVQFLHQVRSVDAARAELETLIATGKNTALYRSMRASINFEAGQKDAGITELQDILKTAEPSDQTRTTKVILAKMLIDTGNLVGARALVEEVLAEDVGQVEALKMRASWLIDEDKPSEAIIDLRAALDQAPRDAEILSLMATAYERDGSRELAGERLALAVEVTGRGAPESLRYARFLLQDKRYASAETVLKDALSATPNSVPLLATLAEVHLGDQQWPQVKNAIAQLRQIGTTDAQRAADQAEAAMMMRSQSADESVAYLQSLIDKGSADLGAVALIVQTQIKQGKSAEAATYLDARLAADPTNPILRFLRAGVYVLSGEPDKGEAIYRTLLTENPADEGPTRALYMLLEQQGKNAEAVAVLDKALIATPNAPVLQWIKAGQLEKAGDYEGAIAIYEAMYEKDSSNLVVANNLASLIASHRTDSADLERAFAIARRLRGSDQPAFLDTYGWIEYNRGNYSEALANLEPAAKGMANDPMVQLHLGLTYVALEQFPEARATLTHALELAGDSPLPEFQTGRDALAKLPAGQ